ncbi:MAG: UDP-N-acetylglucosamine--N-acetylmuramyl-(pentapeptide) pyrophosphoryl-undecaprenol N-acetylglucosamine transferase, partial [Clostridia bacterium]|nr:UDP-N-acetylglucosamine--N-acetylmuramyl-(pentapeptide) pyrophosphoryl-undecaprenol N-acetylglucosamine transferase [Clostridia bacterium]
TTGKTEAKKMLGLEDVQVVVSAFGSQGAKVMNQNVAGIFPLEQEDGFPFHHIHAVGSFGWGWMPDLVKEKGVDYENCASIDMREYIYDMPTQMAAADLVICRSGAMTLSELAVLGKASILVPSPNVTDDQQTKNARLLSDQGAAVLLRESEMSAQVLCDAVNKLLGDEKALSQMEDKVRAFAVKDTEKVIYEKMCAVIRSKKGKS